MVNLVHIRKVTQDVLLFVWFKHGALSEEPPRESGLIPDISDEFMNNLSVSIWIESFRTQFIWDDFFKEHFKRMTVSMKLFANYVSYVCYILNTSPNIHECFFDILSIVSEFSLRCLEGDCQKYLSTSVELFCSFFESELSSKFKNQGGWKKFDEYIRKQYNSIQSKSTTSDHESLLSLFEYFPRSLVRGNRSDYVINGFVLKKRQKPYYVVNGIVLKNITQEEVETNKRAVNFAIATQSRLEKLAQSELFIDFEKTYKQVVECKKKAVDPTVPRKKFQEEPYASLDIRQYSDERQNNGTALRLNDEKSSSETKKPKKQSSSLETLQHPVGMQSHGKLGNKGIKSSGGIINHVEQCSSRKIPKPLVEESSRQVKKEKKIENNWNHQTKNGTYKNKEKPLSSLEAKRFPVGMQSNGTQISKSVKSSVGIKNPGKQCSSEAKQFPVGMESSRTLMNKSVKSSVGIKNPGKQCSPEAQKFPVGMQNNGTQGRKGIKSSSGTINEVEQRYLHEVPKPTVEENGRQVKKEEKIENDWHYQTKHKKNKKKVKKLSSQEVLQNPVRMQNDEEQREKEQESSDGTKNQMKHHSLDFKGELDSPYCKTKVMEGKSVTAQDSLKNQNSDIINLQNKVSHLDIKVAKIETIKKLLGDVALPISSLSNLIQSLGEKYGVQVPNHLRFNIDA